jgi:hypothetical protein
VRAAPRGIAVALRRSVRALVGLVAAFSLSAAAAADERVRKEVARAPAAAVDARAPGAAVDALTHGKEPAAIVSRDIFCSGCAPVIAPPPRAGGERKTPLAVELVATMFCRADPAWSVAVLRDRAAPRDSALVRRGSRVGDAVVVRVLPKRVYFRRGDALEFLELDDAAATGDGGDSGAGRDGARGRGESATPAPADTSIRCTGARCEVERAFVERTLANPAALAGGLRVSPAAGGGLRFDFVRADSPLARLGFRAGDVLRSVNGLELTDAQAMLDVLIKLRRATRLAAALDRRGQRLTFDFEIR